MNISEYKFQALFNNAAIGIIVVNGAGDIVDINDFALGQFNYQRDELLGRKIEALIPSRYRQQHLQHRDNYHGAKAHSRPMGLGMDLFGAKSDGTEFPVEVSLSPYRGNEGEFVIAFVSDISIRKKHEQALLTLNAELEEKVQQRTQSLTDALAREKELNELKSRFVSMASHQFRTPLSTILSSAYLVSKYVSSEDQVKREKHIQRIVSSVNTLTDILNDFLSVGRIEEGKIQVRYAEFDIEKLIVGLIAELQPILKHGQQLVYNHSGDKLVGLDISLLKHILTNLISNAIKFSPEDSAINIGSSNVEGEELVISIKDMGVGIPKEDQEHLFERFFRGTNVVNIQGTGLGLHIVKKYAELMNGTVNVYSEEGKGTEFIITFKAANNY